ncbi:MAG: M3 family metallopeptidase [Opitutae bacterium]|jgi:oligopeptidase A|nr:M3 family metallopeptidase [Opitutae bacterium]
MNPLLDESFHIPWSGLKPENVVPDMTIALERAESEMETIRNMPPEEVDFRNVPLQFCKAQEDLGEAWNVVSHIDQVRNSEELREAYNEMLPKVTAFGTKALLDQKLWKQVKEFAGTKEAQSLDGQEKRLLDELVADFVEAGADLPQDNRTRLEELSTELAQATQKFSENVLDSTNAWQKNVLDESLLEGLPESAKIAARETAKQKEMDGWVFTLHAPSIMPIMKYLDDGAIRKEFWEASCKVGWEGERDNTDLIRRILKLRQEKAEILGKKDYADVVLERRMTGSGARADEFVSDLRDKTADAFARENDQLIAFKAGKTGRQAELLEPWEHSYWSEKQMKEKYDFDEEDMRPYLPIDSVLSGMFSLVTEIFRLRIEERSTSYEGQPANPVEGDDREPIDVWHPEVKFYEVFDSKDHRHLGSFYADWHPRPDKRSGAWMNYFKMGIPGDDGSPRGPHLGLMCGNMTAPVDGKPALLTHYEANTVFHEFGHLLHHLCAEVKFKRLSMGTVPWDYVELPSQIMENWLWERESLDLFARHHETNEPIPGELFDKLIRARNYHAGFIQMRQLFLAKMDLLLHRKLIIEGYGDLEEALEPLIKEYRPKLKTTPPTIARQFGHLFSDPVGYACAYYSYKWSEVLDADAFTRFQKEGIMNPETGLSFRECILSKGNSKPAEELFRDFMGRDPDPQALLARSGLA